MKFKERLEQSFGRAIGMVESSALKSLKAAQKDSLLAGVLQELKPVSGTAASEGTSVQIFLVVTHKTMPLSKFGHSLIQRITPRNFESMKATYRLSKLLSGR